MTVIRPGRGVHIVADEQIFHGVPHYQAGLRGVPQKQDEPKSFDSLASRTQIQSGIKYFLLTKGEVELPTLVGATVGAAVYINKTSDALSLTPDTATHTNVPFGRVTNLPSTFGLNASTMRVDMDLRDDIAIP